jgi:hypothetical protein
MNTDADVKAPQNVVTLVNAVKWYIRYGSETGSLITYNDISYTVVSNRYIMEVSYFFIMFTIWNIVKGIVLDTFNDIKDSKEFREQDESEICFICGFDQKVFARAIDRDAFPQHIEFDHNVWNYIYYMIFIWQQDKDDDDGLEYYIRNMVEINDLSWFPMNKSIRLFESEHTEGEQTQAAQFLSDLTNIENSFDSIQTVFRDQIKRSMNKVEQILSTEDDEGSKRTTAKAKTAKSSGPGIEPLSRMTSMNSQVSLETSTKQQVQHEVVRIILKNISGLNLPTRDAAAGIAIKIISDVNIYIANSLPLLADGNDIDPSKQGTVSVFNNSPQSCLHCFTESKYLVHNGPISMNCNYGIRLQIIQYNIHNMIDVPKFLGSIDVPIPALLFAVQCGGNVHAKFFQTGVDAVDNECDINIFAEATSFME